jgi:hypothetical protein
LLELPPLLLLVPLRCANVVASGATLVSMLVNIQWTQSLTSRLRVVVLSFTEVVM